MSANTSAVSNQSRRKNKLKSTLLVQEMLRDETGTSDTPAKEEKTEVIKEEKKLAVKEEKKAPVKAAKKASVKENKKPQTKEIEHTPLKSGIKLPVKRDYTKKDHTKNDYTKKDYTSNQIEHKKFPLNKDTKKKETKIHTEAPKPTSTTSSLLKQKLEEQKALLDKNRTFDSINKLVNSTASYSLTANNNIDVNKINNMFD